MQLAQEYGPVFSLRRGSERMVYISGYKMVKEALVNQLDSFVDRPIVPLFHVVFKGIGEFMRAWMFGTTNVFYSTKFIRAKQPTLMGQTMLLMQKDSVDISAQKRLESDSTLFIL